MSEPEITRRCSSCGAAIRERAFFCPQCGKELTRNTEPSLEPIHDTVEIVRDVTLTEADFQAHGQKAPHVRPKPDEVVAEPPPDEAKRSQRLGEVGARIQRATTKARDVEGNVVHRVQKFREISSVVLDEAVYDPSLRFVLVAAALFVLFVVIVLLNKLIG